MAVRLEHADPVMVVTLDRPDRRNAVDASTARELSAVFRSFGADPGLHVGVLTGAGGNFGSQSSSADPRVGDVAGCDLRAGLA